MYVDRLTAPMRGLAPRTWLDRKVQETSIRERARVTTGVAVLPSSGFGPSGPGSQTHAVGVSGACRTQQAGRAEPAECRMPAARLGASAVST